MTPTSHEPRALVVKRLAPDQWARYRAIRLKALVDTPNAFGRTYAEDAQFTPERWRAGLSGEAARFVALIGGQDVGTASGDSWRGRSGVAGLFGMWVAPEARGHGVGTQLVRTVIDWARLSGFERLALHVADDNGPAVAFYRRLGFEPTGAVGTLPPPRDDITEHERALTL